MYKIISDIENLVSKNMMTGQAVFVCSMDSWIQDIGCRGKDNWTSCINLTRGK